jgi:carbon storage regulator CsrA
VDGDKIKLGIDAPKHIKIFREELLSATIVLNQQALNAPMVTFDFSGLRGQKADKEN